MEHAAATGSSSVVVIRGTEPIVDWHVGGRHRPIETMSVTKMVVAMIVGVALADEGEGVTDVGVARWLHEWEGDERGRITVAHLMKHTSGLRPVPAPVATSEPSAVRAALELQVEREPGPPFTYNNLAFNLLGEIVKRASGSSIRDLASERVFTPLGFRDWSWRTDDHGDPRCHFGLICRADDLASVGRQLLDPSLLPPWWAKAMLTQGWSCYAQPAWIGDGEFGPVVGRGHDGDGGQYLVVYPDRDAVAIRLREHLGVGDGWSSFPGDAFEAAA
jgi:CubicO group peptidase (beta-lactamase class C family)